jgi:hypothetical protein
VGAGAGFSVCPGLGGSWVTKTASMAGETESSNRVTIDETSLVEDVDSGAEE